MLGSCQAGELPGRALAWQASVLVRLSLHYNPCAEPPQVRVWFAGEMKKTLSVKGKQETYNIDQEVGPGQACRKMRQ